MSVVFVSNVRELSVNRNFEHVTEEIRDTEGVQEDSCLMRRASKFF